MFLKERIYNQNIRRALFVNPQRGIVKIIFFLRRNNKTTLTTNILIINFELRKEVLIYE